jgi:hypothetical protein
MLINSPPFFCHCHGKIAKKPIEKLLDTQNILGFGI